MIGYNILPIGFSNYEKSTIETFFRLAGRRAPHWGLTTRSSEARVVLFNATSDQDVESFRSLVASWQKVIIVGSSDYGTGWPVLPRPIKLTAILGLLDDVANFKASEKNPVTHSMASLTAEVKPAEIKPVISSQVIKAVEPATLAPLSKVARLAVSTPAAAFDKPSMTDVFASITTHVETNEVPKTASATPASVVAAKPAYVPLNEAPSYVAGAKAPDQIANTKRVLPRHSFRSRFVSGRQRYRLEIHAKPPASFWL